MPASTLLFKNAAGQLLADPQEFLLVVWSQEPRTLAEAQALFEEMLTQLQQRGWSRILVNQTTMRPFSGIEQVWVATDWLPRAVRQGGYRHGAVVTSPDVLARLATAYITTTPQHYPVFRSFDTEAAARRWLAQQPAQPAPLPTGT